MTLVGLIVGILLAFNVEDDSETSCTLLRAVPTRDYVGHRLACSRFQKKPDDTCLDECVVKYSSQYICDWTCQYPNLKNANILYNPGVIKKQ